MIEDMLSLYSSSNFMISGEFKKSLPDLFTLDFIFGTSMSWKSYMSSPYSIASNVSICLFRDYLPSPKDGLLRLSRVFRNYLGDNFFFDSSKSLSEGESIAISSKECIRLISMLYYI
jgi:hypothetical protein